MRPHRKYRIGMRCSVDQDGIQWIDIYLMRFRTALFGHSFCLDGTEEVNRRRFRLVWQSLRSARQRKKKQHGRRN
jgi:hypothetical protein